MTIENFRETPILWDGFDGPIGLTIELDLVHPAGLEGFVFTPQVRMAPAYDIAADDLQSSRTFSGGYFKDWHIGEDVGDLVLLKPVLFQRPLLLACSALGMLLAIEPVAAKTLDWDGTLTLDLGPLGSSTTPS